AFVGDQSPAADLHGARSPSLAPHLEEQIFTDAAVLRAEFADRHGERRSAITGGLRRVLFPHLSKRQLYPPPPNWLRPLPPGLPFFQGGVGGGSGDLWRGKKAGRCWSSP